MSPYDVTGSQCVNSSVLLTRFFINATYTTLKIWMISTDKKLQPNTTKRNPYTYTETKMSSFWWNFHHWLHWKLSVWQLSVQPVMKISSKWRHFRFSVIIWMKCNSDTWASWCIKSSTSRLTVEQLFQAVNKENIKAHHRWPFVGIHRGHRWIPLTKGQ